MVLLKDCLDDKMSDVHIQEFEKCQLCYPISLLLPVIMSCYKLYEDQVALRQSSLFSSVPISLGACFSLWSLNNSSHLHSFLRFTPNFAPQHFFQLGRVLCPPMQLQFHDRSY